MRQVAGDGSVQYADDMTAFRVTPMTIRIQDYPQLALITWQRRADSELSEEEALALYEANWRYVDQASMSADEKALLQRLVVQYGHGVLNV